MIKGMTFALEELGFNDNAATILWQLLLKTHHVG